MNRTRKSKSELTHQTCARSGSCGTDEDCHGCGDYYPAHAGGTATPKPIIDSWLADLDHKTPAPVVIAQSLCPPVLPAMIRRHGRYGRGGWSGRNFKAGM
jgi:hypothetical protein